MIPKHFYLAGNKIPVKVRPKLVRGDMLGYFDPQQNEICLVDNYAGKPLPADSLVATFYHEKVHAILHIMGENKLYTNERFVDAFAQLLYQSDKTSKYGPEKKKDKDGNSI